MTQTIDAVYDGRNLHPDSALNFPANSRVRLTIEALPGLEKLDPSFQLLETEETFLGLAPPETTPEEQAIEMAKLREMAATDPKMAAFLDAVERQDIDVDAIIRTRGLQ